MSSISVRFNSFLFLIRFSMNVNPSRFPFRVRLSPLVGLDGLEPSTSRLSGVRSSHLSYKPFYSQALIRPSFFPFGNGGDDGVRTHDPLLAGQVLSQLSYTPMFPGSIPFQRSCYWSPKIEQQKVHTRSLKTSLVIRLRQLREKLSWSP